MIYRLRGELLIINFHYNAVAGKLIIARLICPVTKTGVTRSLSTPPLNLSSGCWLGHIQRRLVAIQTHNHGVERIKGRRTSQQTSPSTGSYVKQTRPSPCSPFAHLPFHIYFHRQEGTPFNFSSCLLGKHANYLLRSWKIIIMILKNCLHWISASDGIHNYCIWPISILKGMKMSSHLRSGCL